MIEYRTVVPPYDPGFLEALHALGSELFEGLDLDDMVWRMTRLPEPSVQVAMDVQIVGFKLGYARAKTCYDSWLGGTRADSRRKGIALRLMEMQHEWLRARGYASVETAAVPSNAAMLTLNLRTGFVITGSNYSGGRHRVTMAKDLTR
jgi:hypothetical protein